MINCASTSTAVLLRPGHRKNRALGPVSLEGGRVSRLGAVAGAAAARAGRAWAADRGRQRPLISGEAQLPSDSGFVSVCENVDVATLRYLTAIRASGLCDPDGLDHRRFITDVPGSRFGYLHGGR